MGFLMISKYEMAKIRFIIPIYMAPELWLALKPIHAFHMVISFVRTGNEVFIPSSTALFLTENLFVKNVYNKWSVPSMIKGSEPAIHKYFSIIVLPFKILRTYQ